MHDLLIPICLFLYISSAVTCITAIYSFRLSNYPIAIWCGFLMLGFSLYSFGYAQEISSESIRQAYFWITMQFISVAYLPSFFILMVLCYQRNSQPSATLISLLIALSSVTVVLAFSNYIHHLLFSIDGFTTHYGLFISDLTLGPFYYIHMVYVNSAWAIAVVILLKHLKNETLYKKQILSFFAGNTIIWICYLINMSNLVPFKIDLSPFAAFFMGIAYWVGLFKYRFVDITPLAREKIFETLADAVIVLNSEHKIIDFNQKSVQIFTQLDMCHLGKDIKLIKFIPDELKNNLLNDNSSAFDLQYKNNVFEIKQHTLRHGKRIVGYILTVCEITERAHRIETLRNHAEIDGLTKIYNRRMILKVLTDILNDPIHGDLSIILFDIDFFKSINDQHGHSTGDRLLSDLSVLIGDYINKSNYLGRYGGDEFIILLPNTSSISALELANQLIALCKNKLSVTLSMGIATANQNDTPTTLIDKADIALYEAKAKGRSQAVRIESMLNCINTHADLH